MKNILLVIDIQNGFMVSGSAMDAKARIETLIASGIFDEVIVTEYSNYAGSPIINLMGWDDCLTEESIALTGKGIADCPHVLRKKKYSAFSDELLTLLKDLNDGELPDKLFLAGVDTGCCVLMTATDLFEYGIRPLVLTYYTGSAGESSYQDAAIKTLHSLIGRNNLYEREITAKEDLSKVLAKAEDVSVNEKDNTEAKARKIIDILSAEGKTISFAESCTAGLAAANLVNIANASTIFNASIVTYSNEAKMKYVSVAKETLERYGAVSEQVAGEMAIGAAKNNGADVGVGISGIAGPTGCSKEKPVGHVCFGFYVDGVLYTFTQDFGAIGRMEVRQKSVDFVYETLLNLLTKQD